MFFGIQMVSIQIPILQPIFTISVLNIQDELIATLERHDDLITVDWLYHQMQKILGSHLIRLGLVDPGISELDLRV